MKNFREIDKVMGGLAQVRKNLDIGQKKVSEENWNTFGNVCREMMETRILLKFGRSSADWRKLVARLIQEISYRKTKGRLNFYQSLIQSGKTSTLKCIDISKEALILFGDGAEEIYLYQPERKQTISEEMKNALNQLLKDRGISIGPAIKNCSVNQDDLIKRLAQELQAMQETGQPRDELDLFYLVIQDGKTLQLKDFDETKQALFLFGNRYEVEVYLMN